MLAYFNTVVAYWDIVNVISNTCTFPIMTSQNITCEKKVLSQENLGKMSMAHYPVIATFQIY